MAGFYPRIEVRYASMSWLLEYEFIALIEFVGFVELEHAITPQRAGAFDSTTQRPNDTATL